MEAEQAAEQHYHRRANKTQERMHQRRSENAPTGEDWVNCAGLAKALQQIVDLRRDQDRLERGLTRISGMLWALLAIVVTSLLGVTGTLILMFVQSP